MDYKEIIGVIAGIVAFLNVVPYVRSILNGKTKPSRSAYAIWLVIDLVTLSSYIASGATSTVGAFAGFALTTVVIFLLSVKYGMGGFQKLDIACVIIALLAIIIWVITNSPELALYTSLSAKLIGYIPILHKVYLYPSTENKLAWDMTAIASIFNVIAITSFTPKIAVAPIALAFIDVLVVLIIYRRAYTINRPATVNDRNKSL